MCATIVGKESPQFTNDDGRSEGSGGIRGERFAANNLMASGNPPILSAAGTKVAESVSFSFDGGSWFALTAFLITLLVIAVAQLLEELGSAAVRMLPGMPETGRGSGSRNTGWTPAARAVGWED